jgi:hypothetical protein
VNVLGETVKFSVTTHLIKRWRERVGNGSYDEITSAVKDIVKKGTKYTVDDCHYRICHGGLCVIFMQLSPLHALAKTVYERDETTLSAV